MAILYLDAVVTRDVIERPSRKLRQKLARKTNRAKPSSHELPTR
jgi:hypothetical protein